MTSRIGQGPPRQGYGVPPVPLPKPAPSIDVMRLAVALDNVDRGFEQGWTPVHYARAIAAEYARLSVNEGGVAPVEPQEPR